MAQVEGRVTASTTYVRAFVHQYVAGRINEARRSIEAYAKQYSETMEDALNVHREGGSTAPIPALQRGLWRACISLLLSDLVSSCTVDSDARLQRHLLQRMPQWQ